jgi:hypothetical protein
MLYGFKNGAAEAIRLAKRYAAANGMGSLNCVEAQHYNPSCDAVDREKGLITWTVRFDGLPRGPYDDGSAIILVNLETSAARILGRPTDALRALLRNRPPASEGASGDL